MAKAGELHSPFGERAVQGMVQPLQIFKVGLHHPATPPLPPFRTLV